MRTLTDHCNSHSILSTFLCNPLHRLACALELDIALTLDVRVRFLANEQNGELRVLRIPIVELKSQSSYLRRHSWTHVKWDRAQVDHSDRGALGAKPYKIAKERFKRGRLYSQARSEQEVIPNIAQTAVQAHQKVVERTG